MKETLENIIDEKINITITNAEENEMSDNEEKKSEESRSELGDLIKLLSQQFGREQAAMSTESVENVIADFDGESPKSVKEK